MSQLHAVRDVHDVSDARHHDPEANAVSPPAPHPPTFAVRAVHDDVADACHNDHEADIVTPPPPTPHVRGARDDVEDACHTTRRACCT